MRASAAGILLLVAMVAPLGTAVASSPRSPIDVETAADGSGAVGEGIRLRLTWHVEPNVAPASFHASIAVPDWVRVDGEARWQLRSDPERALTSTHEVTLTPMREGYWIVSARATDGLFGPRDVLAVRSGTGAGAVARDPSDVLPAREAAVETLLGAWNATHAEVIVRGAKGEGWRSGERLALAPAGQGHVSTVAGDAGEHRESFELGEGVGLSFTAAAYVEVTFERESGGGGHVLRRAAAELCASVVRSDGNVTLDSAPCRYPGEGLDIPLPALAAILAFGAAARARGRRVAGET